MAVPSKSALMRHKKAELVDMVREREQRIADLESDLEAREERVSELEEELQARAEQQAERGDDAPAEDEGVVYLLGFEVGEQTFKRIAAVAALAVGVTVFVGTVVCAVSFKS